MTSFSFACSAGTAAGTAWATCFGAAAVPPPNSPPNTLILANLARGDGGADSATVQILDSAGFAPSSVSIRPGGYVRWVNLSAANHALQTDRNCKAAVIYEGTREIHKLMQADYALGNRQDKPRRVELPAYKK